MSNIPYFIMMVGLPYSGKSYEAQRCATEYHANIHASDDIRAEILGDVQDQTGNEKVFNELHRRVKEDLSNGISTVYDATNINYKRRMAFLAELKHIPCKKICVFMATPMSVIRERAESRERVVPMDVVERMYKNIWIPGEYEGWDSVEIVWPTGFKFYDVTELFNGENGLNFFNQDNPHHEFTVGHHCTATYGLIKNGSKKLEAAALLHDIGKPFTKTFVNSRGETTDVAHYYNHQNVSAYESLFYKVCWPGMGYVANLIQWHMRPYEIKRHPNPEKLFGKFKQLVGEAMYNDIMKLHEADLKAH